MDFEIVQGAKYADLAGAIYDDDVVSEVHKLEHSVVTTGISKDVQWLISDHLSDDGILERVLTIKGFDATDAEVDRERLVVEIVKGEKLRGAKRRAGNTTIKVIVRRSDVALI